MTTELELTAANITGTGVGSPKTDTVPEKLPIETNTDGNVDLSGTNTAPQSLPTETNPAVNIGLSELDVAPQNLQTETSKDVNVDPPKPDVAPQSLQTGTNTNVNINSPKIDTALKSTSQEKSDLLANKLAREAINSKVFTEAQLLNCPDDVREFLIDPDTRTAIIDAKYNVDKLISFELPKIKTLLSYSSIKAISNKIYTAEQLFACEVAKIKLLTSESVTKVIMNKTYTAQQLLGCEIEKIQVLTSPPVLNSITKGHYTTKQLLDHNIAKIKVLTSEAVTNAIKDKVFTAKQLLDCDSGKIEALTDKQAINTIRPEKGKISSATDTISAYAAKLKFWNQDASKTDNAVKDAGLYTAKELLACNTQKILALTDKVSQALIINHIYSIEQMLTFDVAQLETFIAKARGYGNPENAVENLGKVYFFALYGKQLPLRELLEKEKASANNNDNMESPLAVTVHAGFGPNAHLLVQHKGHFNHHDFVMDSSYVNELIQYIPNILSKQEQQLAFTGFRKASETSNCAKQFEDYCLVENGVPLHEDL